VVESVGGWQLVCHGSWEADCLGMLTVTVAVGG
jgi:hypothetical protein